MCQCISLCVGPNQVECMNDQDAVTLSKDGDQEAFRCLVERYGPVLQGTAFLMTKNSAVAEELTQDALLSAWRGMGSFKEGLPVKPWLVRILVNRVLEYQRRGSLLTTPMDDAPEPRSSDRVADEVEARDAVERGLAQLDPDHRQVLMLRYYAELSVPEISEALGWPEGTVKSRLHRATGLMRDLIGE